MAISFATEPSAYRHWRLEFDGPVATLSMAVTPDAGLRDDYELKLNSYDLGVDIELHDAVQRLRFEHPEVKAVVVTGGLDKVFCAGANIQMLAGSSHGHKVNFCKFTNETRNAIEDATAHSGQTWIAAVNGTAAGGGYELALACDEILLVDDRASAVSLPEVPLLAVLPGHRRAHPGRRQAPRPPRPRRRVRHPGRGRQGRSRPSTGGSSTPSLRAAQFDDLVARAGACPSGRVGPPRRRRPASRCTPLRRDDRRRRRSRYERRRASTIDRGIGAAHITVAGRRGRSRRRPTSSPPPAPTAWLLAAARELDDAMLHLRFNEPELGTWVLRTEGDADASPPPRQSSPTTTGWPGRSACSGPARSSASISRPARSSRLVEPGSCFAGTLAELALAADRTLMLDGTREDDELPAADAPAHRRPTTAGSRWPTA